MGGKSKRGRKKSSRNPKTGSQAAESDSIDQFDKLFSRMTKFASKGHSIAKVEVRETEKFAHLTTEIALTLFDGTVMTGCIPAIIEPGDKSFIRSYSERVIAPAIIGHGPTEQDFIDGILSQILSEVSKDDLPHKMKKLAKNVNWATSVAVCKAGAYANNLASYKYLRKLLISYQPEYKGQIYDIPDCVFSFTEGAITSAEQHLQILPQHGQSVCTATKICKKIYDSYFKDKIAEDEEGSYTPNIQDIKKGLEELTKIIDKLGYKKEVSIGLNVGASQLYVGNDSYRFRSKKEDDDGHLISAKDLNDVYRSLLKEYHIKYIEDAFHRDNWDYLSKLSVGISTVTGEDLKLICDYMDEKGRVVCSSILIKVSEAESVSEFIKSVSKFIHNGLVDKVMDSHSCESYDTFIADLCVGLMVDRMKIGVSCITSDCKVCEQCTQIINKMETISCRGWVNGRPDLEIICEEVEEWDKPDRIYDYFYDY